MAICKARFPRSRLCPAKKSAALLATAAALFLAGNNLSAQSSSPSSPSAPAAPAAPSVSVAAPSVSMPSMPKISAPVAGSSFYTPGKNFLTKEKSAANAQNSATTEQKNSAASNNLETTLLDGGADFSGLTAQDLVQLAKSGSLSNVSSLFGNAGFYKNPSSGAADNKILLKKILSELDQIKKSQSQNLAAASTGAKPSALPPKILRFVVNANDILSKCVQVYFSDLESDGSFLLTGDARTLFDNQTVSETFYLLFKSSGTKNSKTVYSVAPSLSQSQKTSTPLSAFCSASELTAERVGNLVTLRSINGAAACDLLLDIGKAR